MYEILFEEYNENFGVALETHRRIFPKIVEKIRAIGKRHKNMKNKILKEFSIKSWDKLSPTEKSKHSLLNCKRCTTKEKYQTLITAFPVNKQACTHNKQIQLQTITQHIYTQANLESFLMLWLWSLRLIYRRRPHMRKSEQKSENLHRISKRL